MHSTFRIIHNIVNCIEPLLAIKITYILHIDLTGVTNYFGIFTTESQSDTEVGYVLLILNNMNVL